MGDFERLVLAHDNVNLDIVFLSSVVCTAGIDLLNSVVVSNNEVDQLADEVLGRRLADKQPDVVESVRSPREEDQDTDKDGTDGIDIPDDTATDNGHGETEGVDNDVVAVIDEEDMNGRIASVDEAVDAEGSLAEYSSGNKGNGDDVKFFRFTFAST